jgi:DHA2 family multidrug resistance protein
VAGGFGRAAFVAVFMTASSPLLPLVLAIFAPILLLPGSFGAVASALLGAACGWQALFFIQAIISAALGRGSFKAATERSPMWYCSMHQAKSSS